jgi:hypothetical protein
MLITYIILNGLYILIMWHMVETAISILSHRNHTSIYCTVSYKTSWQAKVSSSSTEIYNNTIFNHESLATHHNILYCILQN